MCFTRQTDWNDVQWTADKKDLDVVLHAAFNPNARFTMDEMHGWMGDTILLTQKLLKLLHKKFVCLSTTDVYPKNNILHVEDENIYLSAESTYNYILHGDVSKFIRRAVSDNLRDILNFDAS